MVFAAMIITAYNALTKDSLQERGILFVAITSI